MVDKKITTTTIKKSILLQHVWFFELSILWILFAEQLILGGTTIKPQYYPNKIIDHKSEYLATFSYFSPITLYLLGHLIKTDLCYRIFGIELLLGFPSWMILSIIIIVKNTFQAEYIKIYCNTINQYDEFD